MRHWTHRSIINNVLSDIYDGQVWQNLKESSAMMFRWVAPRISERIGALENFIVTGNQCKDKWNALKLGYENLKRMREIQMDFPFIYNIQ